MKPGILREIAIILLLLVVIIFAFIILFYDSVSVTNAAISSINYETSKPVSNALQEINNKSGMSEESSDEVLKSYSIGEADLAAYESDDSYSSGKVDPFSEEASPEEAVTITANTNTEIQKSEVSATPENTKESQNIVAPSATTVETNEETKNVTNTVNTTENKATNTSANTSTPGKYFEKKNSK